MNPAHYNDILGSVVLTVIAATLCGCLIALTWSLVRRR